MQRNIFIYKWTWLHLMPCDGKPNISCNAFVSWVSQSLAKAWPHTFLCFIRYVLPPRGCCPQLVHYQPDQLHSNWSSTDFTSYQSFTIIQPIADSPIGSRDHITVCCCKSVPHRPWLHTLSLGAAPYSRAHMPVIQHEYSMDKLLSVSVSPTCSSYAI